MGQTLWSVGSLALGTFLRPATEHTALWQGAKQKHFVWNFVLERAFTTRRFELNHAMMDWHRNRVHDTEVPVVLEKRPRPSRLPTFSHARLINIRNFYCLIHKAFCRFNCIRNNQDFRQNCGLLWGVYDCVLVRGLQSAESRAISKAQFEIQMPLSYTTSACGDKHIVFEDTSSSITVLSREHSELFVWFLFAIKSLQASYSSFRYRPLTKVSCCKDSYMTIGAGTQNITSFWCQKP